MRALIVPAVLATLVLAACGGGDSNSSPTPEPTPSPTPVPIPCTASNLYGALVTTEDTGGAPLLTIGITNTLTVCTVSGPPTVNWYREDGTKIDTPAALKSRCQPQAGDYSTCVFEREVQLPEGAPTPAAGVDGQAVAVVGVQQDSACASPSEPAHFVGLQFPDVSPDVQIQLAETLAVPTCGESIFLYGWGPLPTPQE